MSLEELIPVKKYGVNGWARVLKGLFPPGVLWDFPLLDDNFVEPVGIVSGEAFGSLDIPRFNTYILDNFDGAVYDSFWDSDFTSNWSLSELPPSGGDYTSIKGISGDNTLVSKANSIGGDLRLDTTFRYGTTDSGNKSTALSLYDQSDSEVVSIGIDPGGSDIIWEHSALTQDSVSNPYSQYATFKVRIEREGTTLTGYYDIGSGWVAFSNPLTGVSGDLYLVVNGADNNGIKTFEFWAGDGLPYAA